MKENCLADVLPPLQPRQYSITNGEAGGTAPTMEIVVGQLWYGGLTDELLPQSVGRSSLIQESVLFSDAVCCFCEAVWFKPPVSGFPECQNQKFGRLERRNTSVPGQSHRQSMDNPGPLH